jgi:hypothetical protein
LLGGGEEQSTTIKNEHAHAKFQGVVVKNNQSPSKTSMCAHFKGDGIWETIWIL